MRKNTKSGTSYQKDFYTDTTSSDELFAVTVRSPAEKGSLKEIVLPPLPKGVKWITASDITGSKTVELRGQKIPVFCNGRISYKGEPLGLLAGRDEDLLRSLASLINPVIVEDSADDAGDDGAVLYEKEVRYGPYFEEDAGNSGDGAPRNETEIPAAMTESPLEQAAAEADTSGTKPPSPGTALGSLEAKPPGPEDPADTPQPGPPSMFDSSKYVYEHEWIYNLKDEYYGETNGAVALWKNGSVTVQTPTRWPGSLRKALSRVLGTDAQSILIQKTVSQCRTTSSIWYNSIIACQAAVASRVTGKAVRLVYSREEQDAWLNVSKPVRIKYKAGINDEGGIEALEAEIKLDSGFAEPLVKEHLERLVIAATGAYSVKNLHIKAVAMTSRSPAASVDIRQLDAAAFFALENHISACARLCRLTPLEFRRKNHLETGPGSRRNEEPPHEAWHHRSRPHAGLSAFVFDIEKFNNVLDALAKSADFERKYASYGLDATYWGRRLHPKQYVSAFSTPLKGIGFACAFEGSSYYGTKPYRAHVMEATLESKNELVIHSTPVPSSVQDLWTAVASDILGVRSLRVKIDTSFKSEKESDSPDDIYGNQAILTALLSRCCAYLKKFISRDTFPVTIRKRSAPSTEWDGAAFKGRPFYSTSFAAASVEVEVNPFNYRGNIRSIDIVVNGGKIPDPKRTASSIRLAVQQTLSSLIEDDVLESGALRISFMQSEKDSSPVEELVYKVVPAAYTQAVSQALDYIVDELPLKLDSLHAVIKKRKVKTKESIKKRAEAGAVRDKAVSEPQGDEKKPALPEAPERNKNEDSYYS